MLGSASRRGLSCLLARGSDAVIRKLSRCSRRSGTTTYSEWPPPTYHTLSLSTTSQTPRPNTRLDTHW